MAPLGDGAMGQVFRAWDERDREWRAVKILDPRQAKRKNVRQRFENEGRAMQQIRHPNVVAVYHAGTDGDRSYMAMEILTGGSLYKWLGKNGSMSPRLAVRLLHDVLRGLEVAHGLGIVHRDIKPQNILLAWDGSPKLGDFGIAHLEGLDLALTRTGSTMGTVSYMAPEQGKSAKGVDARADLYSIGATLYAMVTGADPMQLHSRKDGLDAQPRPVAEVIRKATQKAPEDRYEDAAAMRKALAAAEEALPVLAGGPPLGVGSPPTWPPPPPLPGKPREAAFPDSPTAAFRIAPELQVMAEPVVVDEADGGTNWMLWAGVVLVSAVLVVVPTALLAIALLVVLTRT